VTAGNHDAPLWASGVAFVVLAALGLWLWRERKELGYVAAGGPFKQTSGNRAQ
jgi:hypothetical protein